MKHCPFCGAALQDNMVFCLKCGKRFPIDCENQEAVVGAPVPKAGRAQKKKSTKALLAVGICFAVFFCAACAFLVWIGGALLNGDDAVLSVVFGLDQKESRPGISTANLCGGGIVTENDDYVFFIDEKTGEQVAQTERFTLFDLKEACIWQYGKADGSLKKLSVRASGLNVYGDKLYYYDRDKMEVCSCDIGEDFGANIQILGLVGFDGEILFLDGKIILQNGNGLSGAGTCAVMIYDAKSLELIETFPLYYKFTYLEDTLYLLSDFAICLLNIKTMETETYPTPTRLCGVYPTAGGKVYCRQDIILDYKNEFSQTIYVFDTQTKTFSKAMTCGYGDLLLCKDGRILLHEYTQTDSRLYDISSGRKVLYSSQNIFLNQDIMKGFVVEGNCEVPVLGWPSDAVFGCYRPNGESTFIVP